MSLSHTIQKLSHPIAQLLKMLQQLLHPIRQLPHAVNQLFFPARELLYPVSVLAEHFYKFLLYPRELGHCAGRLTNAAIELSNPLAELLIYTLKLGHDINKL